MSDQAKERLKVSEELTDREEKYLVLLEKIRNLDGESDYDLWKYYQNRADEIKTRLWTTGTWLIALMLALLALAFQVGVLSFQDEFPPLGVEQRWPGAIIAVLGIAIALHGFYAVKDQIDHIASNWFRADCLKDNFQKLGRYYTNWGWVSLIFIGGLILSLYLYILLASLLPNEWLILKILAACRLLTTRGDISSCQMVYSMEVELSSGW